MKENKFINERYLKNIGTIGEDGQRKLFSSHVAIVGAGGLGGTVFEILVRYGMGKITIIDFDKFERSNLNRQILATTDVLGKNKTQIAIERGQAINPDVKIAAHACRITDENALELLHSANLICDCLGNIKDRFILERAARSLKIPMVHAAVAGERGQILTIFPDSAGLAAIYGNESLAPKSGDELTLGTPPSTVVAIAAMQAHEAVNVLTGQRNTLKNCILYIDLGTWKMKRLIMPAMTSKL